MSGTDAWKFQGEAVILVEEGALATDVGGEKAVLERGDSIHFDASLPHRWIATGTGPATAVVFAIIPERLQGDLMSRISDATERLESQSAAAAATE
jgi:quercetin dioxygenase-like cupin family protein